MGVFERRYTHSPGIPPLGFTENAVFVEVGKVGAT